MSEAGNDATWSPNLLNAPLINNDMVNIQNARSCMLFLLRVKCDKHHYNVCKIFVELHRCEKTCLSDPNKCDKRLFIGILIVVSVKIKIMMQKKKDHSHKPWLEPQSYNLSKYMFCWTPLGPRQHVRQVWSRSDESSFWDMQRTTEEISSFVVGLNWKSCENIFEFRKLMIISRLESKSKKKKSICCVKMLLFISSLGICERLQWSCCEN